MNKDAYIKTPSGLKKIWKKDKYEGKKHPHTREKARRLKQLEKSKEV